MCCRKATSPVRNCHSDEVCNDPHLRSREMIIEVEQVLSGKVKAPGSLFKFSETPGEVKFPAPILGESNHDVLSEILGYSDEEINRLSEEGVIEIRRTASEPRRTAYN